VTTFTEITPAIPLSDLSADKDMLDQPIAVGDTVRCFDFAMGVMPNGKIGGTTRTGEYAAWVDGTVEAIGEDVLEGCPRYRVRSIRRRHGKFLTEDTDTVIYPPLNGTPTLMGKRCMGVFKLSRLVTDVDPDPASGDFTVSVDMTLNLIVRGARDEDHAAEIGRQLAERVREANECLSGSDYGQPLVTEFTVNDDESASVHVTALED